MDKYISVAEMASILGCSKSTLLKRRIEIMKNLEIRTSETEKEFIVIPKNEYSDMAMTIGALLAENENLKERVGEYKDMFRRLAIDVEVMKDEIKELKKARK